MNEIPNQIFNSITTILSDHQTINLNELTLVFTHKKYSATLALKWHMQIRHEFINTDDWVITYDCITCSKSNVISGKRFLRKINQTSVACPACRNWYKWNTHDDMLISVAPKNRSDKVSVKPITDIFSESLISFDDMPVDYKEQYYSKHLSVSEFEKMKHSIYKFNNSIDIINLVYFPIYKVNNQMKFSNVMYDTINNVIIKLVNPQMRCDSCNTIWKSKHINMFKNRHKILCIDCNLSNNTFKKRHITNIAGDNIIYQSKLELKFIEWCASNNVIVVNGPHVEYDFDGKTRKYIVDFRINDDLIEIKDNHIWHIRQIESGKWDAKVHAVQKFINEHMLCAFHLITPYNWNEALNLIKI